MLRDFSDAAGLFDRTRARDEVDGERRETGGGDKYSDGSLERGGEDSVFYRSGRSELFLRWRRWNAVQRKHDSRRQHNHIAGGGFFRCDSAGGNERGRFVSLDRTWGLRRGG